MTTIDYRELGSCRITSPLSPLNTQESLLRMRAISQIPHVKHFGLQTLQKHGQDLIGLRSCQECPLQKADASSMGRRICAPAQDLGVQQEKTSERQMKNKTMRSKAERHQTM